MKNRSYKIKSAIGLTGYVANLLPNKDKADILEYLLQLPASEVQDIASDKTKPSFIAASAKMIVDGDMGGYMETLRICREMYEKEQSQTVM